MYNINAVEVWLSLVEYYVRDVGAAGSNPVTSTSAERAHAICGSVLLDRIIISASETIYESAHINRKMA